EVHLSTSNQVAKFTMPLQLLKRNNLDSLATQQAEEGFVGGISKQDTDKHLAWRYNGSCARVVLSILDPKHQLTKISNAYATLFAGNRVFLADLPSGSGAAVMSILCTLAELRRHKVLPRHPLEVVIVGGEISDTAIKYFEEQLRFITPILKQQAITIVDYSLRHWDVMDKQSTSNLTREMTIKSQGCQNRMLILCNFNGFLAGSRWKKAKERFDEIFRHSTDKSSAVIWIEPQTNKASAFFDTVNTWFSDTFNWLISKQKQQESLKSDVNCKQSFIDGHFRVNLSVHRFDLPQE
ncbi:hypothetical protein, partial [Vibrio fluvialis]|uniref:hypothetical protein n=2 Tax=Vibrio fluvialis TaxID=676 RepID=UPI001EE9DE23